MVICRKYDMLGFRYPGTCDEALKVYQFGQHMSHDDHAVLVGRESLV